MNRRSMCGVLLLLLAACQVATAQEDSEAAAEDKKPKAEQFAVTEHIVAIGNQRIGYTATAGKMTMKSDEGKEKAEVFFIAYERSGEANAAQRPITFCFNGGPGSSSVWLHLGMLGPKRMRLPSDAQPVVPPYQVQENPFSLLDITDLVFIDPVSTGYSRPAKGEEKAQFHGYNEDIRSVGQFIHDYTTRFERWTSKKYLIGESYGGMRAAGLSDHLRSRYRMDVNGVVLVSAAVDFRTLLFQSGNDLPCMLFVPGYAATAWYHKALPEDLQKLPLAEVVKQAEQFAVDELSLALLKGDSLSDERRAEVAKKLSRYTGLSQEYVSRADLRVSMGRFGRELLRSRGLSVGRFDSRYTGSDRDTAGEYPGYDPSGAAVFGAYTAALNDYVRSELQYKDDRVYEILTQNVQPWSFDDFENQYVSSVPSLRRAMTANPLLKVFVAGGYYDLATPPFTMDYSINHLGVVKKLRSNVTTKLYEAGHMMYVHEPSLKQLREDLVQWYKQ